MKLDSDISAIQGRVGQIDSIRGYAVIGVLAVHCTEAAYPSTPGLLNAMALGSRGVQLFYIASAFSMFLVLSRHPLNTLTDLRNFVVRRFARLAPMFWLAIILYLYMYGFASRYWAPDGVGWVEVLLTTMMMHTWWPNAANSIVPGGWSVGVEVTFYMLVPALTLLVRNLWTALFLLIAASVFSYPACLILQSIYAGSSSHAGLIDQFSTVLAFPPQMPAFAGGIFLFFLYRTGVKIPPYLAILPLAVSVWLMSVITNDTGYWFSVKGWTIQFTNLTLFTLLLLLASAAVVLSPRLPIDNFAARYIGKVSYSIYLLHIALITPLVTWAQWIGADQLNGDVYYLLFTTVTVAVCTAAASVTYKFIEKPGMDWARRMTEKRSACKADAAIV